MNNEKCSYFDLNFTSFQNAQNLFSTKFLSSKKCIFVSHNTSQVTRNYTSSDVFFPLHRIDDGQKKTQNIVMSQKFRTKKKIIFISLAEHGTMTFYSLLSTSSTWWFANKKNVQSKRNKSIQKNVNFLLLPRRLLVVWIEKANTNV